MKFHVYDISQNSESDNRNLDDLILDTIKKAILGSIDKIEFRTSIESSRFEVLRGSRISRLEI